MNTSCWHLAFVVVIGALTFAAAGEGPARKTVVSIRGDSFLINGKPTYAGRVWNGHRIEGLLLNARLVQGVFDDLNPETRHMWQLPDGTAFDADRNTDAFVAQMSEWRSRGLIAFTINFQGGSPQGYSKSQPWINSAFDFKTGALRPDYAARMERVIDRADELGMVVILGYLYFGQEPRFESEQAVIAAIDAATDWVVSRGYTNVIVEINNECNVRYKHEVVKPGRVHEMITRVQQSSSGKVKNPAGRLLVSTSYGGGTIPGEAVTEAADFLLIHGNGVKQPERIREMVRRTRGVKTYRGQPIVFNEDDHFDFDKPDNNFIAAVTSRAGWGYFDYRMKGEGFDEGYQSVPTNWRTSSARKRGFFKLLAEITGSDAGR